jgi:hypothetical protein
VAKKLSAKLETCVVIDERRKIKAREKAVHVTTTTISQEPSSGSLVVNNPK